MNGQLHAHVAQLHNYLYGRTVGQTVNYGAFHGFFRQFPEVGVEINQLASRLVGAVRAQASKAELLDLLEALEGKLMLAQTVETLAEPDAQKALELLELVKGEI